MAGAAVCHLHHVGDGGRRFQYRPVYGIHLDCYVWIGEWAWLWKWAGLLAPVSLAVGVVGWRGDGVGAGAFFF